LTLIFCCGFVFFVCSNPYEDDEDEEEPPQNEPPQEPLPQAANNVNNGNDGQNRRRDFVRPLFLVARFFLFFYIFSSGMSDDKFFLLSLVGALVFV